IDHRAEKEIAARIGRPLPSIAWKSITRYGPERDSIATRLLALRNVAYVSNLGVAGTGWFQLTGNSALPVTGFEWAEPVAIYDVTKGVAGLDTVNLVGPAATNVARIRVGNDTFAFDLRPLAQSAHTGGDLRVEGTAGDRHGVLALTQLNGNRPWGGVQTGTQDTIRVSYWGGFLLLGKR